ncbi:MAG: ABC transporter permease [Gemmatimonadales bacterium]
MWRFLRPAPEQEVRAELESHLEHAVAELVAKGMAPDEARRQALHALGRLADTTRRLERGAERRNRAETRRAWLGELAQDVRFAFRSFRRWPLPTAVVTGSIALGVAGTLAVFAVVKAVLLAPLPYPAAERLVRVAERVPTGDRWELSYPAFRDLRDRSRTLDRVIGYSRSLANVAMGEETVQIPTATVSVDALELLGAIPVAGRGFLPADGSGEGPPVAVVSERLWRSRFGRSPDLVGSTQLIEGTAVTIVGVLPADFRFPEDETAIWLPLPPAAPWMENRAVHIVEVVGRLAPGATVAGATAELDAQLARAQQAEPGSDPEHRAAIYPLHEGVVGAVQPTLTLLLAAAATVLLLVTVNVGGMLLTRAVRRDREIGIRRALGARPGRLARQLMTESLVLASLGGILGLGLAYLGLGAVLGQLPAGLPRLSEVRFDPIVLASAAGVVLISGLLFGLAPTLYAVRSSRPSPLGHVAVGGRSWQRAARRALVTAQLALAQVLLVAMALLAVSLLRLQRVDPGFDPSSLLTMTVTLPPDYSPERVIGFYEDLPARLERLPGVSSATAVSRLPISGGEGSGDLTIEGRTFPPGGSPPATFRRVLPNYFQVAGIPLVSGRVFDATDRGQGDFVVAINESFARRYWPDRDPVGARIKVGPAESEPWLTVVGVVGDVHNVGLADQPGLTTYEPYAQRPGRRLSVLVRAAGDPTSLIEPVRRALRAGDASVPIVEVGLMQQRIARSLAPRRFVMWLVSGFGALAVAIAVIGVWGLARQSVDESRRELGVRAALGAAPASLVRGILGGTALLAAIGIGLGTAASLVVRRLIEGQLFATAAADPVVVVTVGLALGLIAIAATLLPAIDGSRTDPSRVLRTD